MNKELVAIKLLEMLLLSEENNELTTTVQEVDPLVGKPVIVRSRDSGVHYGYLEYNEGRTVQLKNSRRMWRWWAAKQMTLSAVAEFGLNHDKDLRIQNVLDTIRILDACEIIPCSEEAVRSIESVETYDEQ